MCLVTWFFTAAYANLNAQTEVAQSSEPLTGTSLVAVAAAGLLMAAMAVPRRIPSPDSPYLPDSRRPSTFRRRKASHFDPTSENATATLPCRAAPLYYITHL